MKRAFLSLITLGTFNSLISFSDLDRIGAESAARILEALPLYDFTTQSYPLKSSGDKDGLKNFLNSQIENVYNQFEKASSDELENSGLMLLLLREGIAIIESKLSKNQTPYTTKTQLTNALTFYKKFANDNQKIALNNARGFLETFINMIQKTFIANDVTAHSPINTEPSIKNIYAQALLIYAVNDTLDKDPEVCAELINYWQTWISKNNTPKNSKGYAALQGTALFKAIISCATPYILNQTANSFNALSLITTQ